MENSFVYIVNRPKVTITIYCLYYPYFFVLSHKFFDARVKVKGI